MRLFFVSDFMKQGMQGSRFMMLKVPRTSQCTEPRACQPGAHGCALPNLPGASHAVTVSCSQGVSVSPTGGSKGEARSSHWSALVFRCCSCWRRTWRHMAGILNTSANASRMRHIMHLARRPHTAVLTYLLLHC